MSWFSKLFKSSPASTAGEAIATGVTGVVKGVSDVVERWAPSEAAKYEMSQAIQKLTNEAVASARTYDPRSTATGKVAELINVIVDAANRTVRPGFTVMLAGGVFGWWSLPAPGAVDAVYLGWFENIILFWFGGRMLFKDLPAVISYITALRKAK